VRSWPRTRTTATSTASPARRRSTCRSRCTGSIPRPRPTSPRRSAASPRPAPTTAGPWRTTPGRPRPSGPPTDEPLSADDLRDAWPLLDLGERSDGLRILPREDAEDLFIGLPAADQAKLILHWPGGQRRQWMRLLEPDDVADVIQEAGDDARGPLLALLDEPTRKEVTALLAYAEDEAGGLMNTRFAHLRPQMTVDEAISYLRRQAQGAARDHLRRLRARPRSCTAARRGLVPRPVRRRRRHQDRGRRHGDRGGQGQRRPPIRRALSHIFAEHDLNVIPVVDDAGRMKGIVMVDDIVDVVQEEATEDIQKFGGMAALDLPYLQSSLTRHDQETRGPG
jgi:magnesium transporter